MEKAEFATTGPRSRSWNREFQPTPVSQEPKIPLPEIAPAAREPKRAAAATAEPSDHARLLEIESMMREVLALRRAEKAGRPRLSKLALAAFVLALAALLCSLGQTYYSWEAYARANDSARELTDLVGSIAPPPALPTEMSDLRTQITIPELAKRAPSIRTGNLQAWWAGEQARQVQRLEAQAKRQTLAGDLEGAARSASRADTIRGSIPALAEFEKPAIR